MRILYSIILIGLLSGVAYAQDNNMDPTDHEIATWQFRSISPSDVANFLSNEDNVFRKAVKSACDNLFYEAYFPDPVYCTDNAAMIACAGYHRYKFSPDSKADLLNLDASTSSTLG